VSSGSRPAPQAATPTELLGRIRELHAAVAEGANHRARLAGENAVLMDLVKQANDEIVSLRARIADLTPQSPAGPALDETQAPTLN
jgi:predicted nuclease with TOPRIM domain